LGIVESPSIEPVSPAVGWPKALMVSIVLATIVFGARLSTNTLVEQRLTGRTASGAVAAGDQTQYLGLARHFRGEPLSPEVVAPFAYRVLPPFLAALMPGNPRVNFIGLNFASVVLAEVFLYALIVRLGLGTMAATLGAGLYAVSFPVFYYGTDALTDPMATAFLTLAYWAIYENRLGWYLVAASLGILCRETDLAAVLVFAVWQLVRPPRQWVRLLVGIVIPFTVAILPRLWFAQLSHGATYIHSATWDVLLFNLSRPRTYLTIVLTLWFVPAALTWYLVRTRRLAAVFPSVDGARFVQIMGAVLLLIPAYALVAAYSDGRFFWVLYPAAIPFAVGCALASAERPAAGSRSSGAEGIET
jgi:hypothetical protein